MSSDITPCPKTATIPDPVGQIGHHAGGRRLPHDSFVVVWRGPPTKANSDNFPGIRTDREVIFNPIGVIYPRMREVDGKLIFGQDKSSSEPESASSLPHSCTCSVYQGCDFVCSCGAGPIRLSRMG